MNYGKYIAQQILEGINQRTIAIYPGAFKPPQRAHLEVVKRALEKADEVVVLVSKGDRGGVQVGQSLKIWDLYLKTLGADASRVKVQVAKSETPVRDFYDMVKEFPNTKFLAVYGKKDAKRFSSIANKEKYPNVEILDSGNVDGVSATSLRSAIKSNDIGAISQLIPKEVKPQEIIDIIPADTILTENELGTWGDIKKVEFLGNLKPYVNFLTQIGDDWEEGEIDEELFHEIENLFREKPLNLKKVINVLKKYNVYDKYLPLLNLNENELGGKADIDPDQLKYLQYIPYFDILMSNIQKDWGKDSSLYHELLNYFVAHEKNVSLKEIIKILKEHDVYDRYFALLSLNENLESHAKYELEKAGLMDKDSDYDGMIGKAVLELMKTFSKQGHSGFSASWVRDLFNKLAGYETITPITSDPKEWMDVYEHGAGDIEGTLWQSKRNPALFSNDGGKTWWNVDEKTIKEGISKGIKAYQALTELSDKELKFWALHYDLFQTLNNPDFEKTYRELRQKEKGEKLEALNYFYKIFSDSNAVRNLLESNQSKSDFKKFVNYINEIAEYCCKDLGIEKPEILLVDEGYTQENKSFGGYFPGQKKINLVIKNRNCSDVGRTLAHEIRHMKQDIDGKLNSESGKDGSPEENECNAYAGKIMREFNKKYPEILTLVNDKAF